MFGKCRYCHEQLNTALDVKEHARLHQYEHEGNPVDIDLNTAPDDPTIANLLYFGDATAMEAKPEETFDGFGGGGEFAGGGASESFGDPVANDDVPSVELGATDDSSATDSSSDSDSSGGPSE